MEWRWGRLAAAVSLTVGATCALAGCVYGPDDFSLPDGDRVESTDPPPRGGMRTTPSPAPRILLPPGCSLERVGIAISAPEPGERGRLLAVRTLTVRPGGSSGAEAQPLTIWDLDLDNAARLAGHVSSLVDERAWAGMLLERMRKDGVVTPTFGDSVTIRSFGPAEDVESEYVIGYLGDQLRVPFSVTACDGSPLGSGYVVGFDPAVSAVSVLVHCGSDAVAYGVSEELRLRLSRYCGP
jgi:hypothetical protein